MEGFDELTHQIWICELTYPEELLTVITEIKTKLKKKSKMQKPTIYKTDLS